MTAELINARYLAEKCASLGLDMYYQVTVGDNYERMMSVVKTALGRSDIIIVTGGLGPTEDDLTKEVCAEAMGMELEEDPHTRACLEAFFKNNIYKEIPENNWKMITIPHGSVVLDNPNGMAPGLIMEKNGKTYLEKRQNSQLVSHMVKICGYGESQVEDKILDLIDKQTNPTIATYAKTAEVQVRLTAKASTREEGEALIAPVMAELFARFGDCIFTTEEDVTLEMAVVDLLQKKHLTMATAESCTGGMIAARLVNVSGVSDVFMQGMVTYSNEAKIRLLGVKEETLAAYGAVSRETALEMALGGAERSQTDVCVAVTGLAGPGGGSQEKPVGLVYMACAVKGKAEVLEYHFKGNRGKIREQSMMKALDLVRRCVLKAD